MKKMILVCGAIALLFSACKKSDSSTSGNRKSILTSGKWRITAATATIEYPAPIGTQTIDAFATIPACQHDDLYIFNADGTGSTDAGATKCNSSDPQVKTAGTWALANNDTQLTVSDGGTTVTSDIQTLDNSSLVIKYVTNYNGIRTTQTTSYSHQ